MSPPFRQSALQRVSSPEQLDKLLRIVAPRAWLTLAGIGFLIAVAIFWSIYGSISFKVQGQGILLQDGGIFTVNSPSSGNIEALFVTEGDSVVMGQVLARIRQPDLLAQIASVRNDVQRLLETLREVQEFHQDDLARQRRSLALQREALEKGNADLRDQIAWYQERIREMVPLVEAGAIAGQQLFETRQDLARAQNTLRDNSNQITRLLIQEEQLVNDQRTEERNAQAALDQARDRLRELLVTMDTESRVVSPFHGRIIGIGTNLGAAVQNNAPLMTMAVELSADLFLQAVMYFAPDKGQQVRPGMTMQVNPLQINVEEYGYIVAVVSHVAEFPSAPAEMQRVLQNETLVRELTSTGAPVEVRALLVPNPRTPSGFQWTSSTGPNARIVSGNMAGASVEVRRERPIEQLLPLLRKYLLGVGQE